MTEKRDWGKGLYLCVALLTLVAGAAAWAVLTHTPANRLFSWGEPPPVQNVAPGGNLPGPVGDGPPADPQLNAPGEAPKDEPKDADADQPGPKVSAKTIYRYVLKSAVWITGADMKNETAGTGVLIDRENRLVLTTREVARPQRDLVAFFPVYDKDGKVISTPERYLEEAERARAAKGKVVSNDKLRDLALVQLDRLPDGVDALPFARAEPEEGDHLHSVFNSRNTLWIYTPGVVRSVSTKRWKGRGEDETLTFEARVIEATSPAAWGLTSSALCVNDRGELVGVQNLIGQPEAVVDYFIERGTAEEFINKAFASAPELQGKKWARSQRRPLPTTDKTPSLPDLIAKLSSPDNTVRAEGAYGLGKLGPDARKALPELVKALGDKDSFVRRLVVDALRQIGSPTPNDLPDLLPFLESASPEARFYVLAALAALGHEKQAAPAATAVLKAAGDPDVGVRRQALRTIGSMAGAIGEKEARAALEKGLEDRDGRVRSAAAEALITAVKSDVPKLLELLKHKEAGVRFQAAQALGRLGDKARPALADLKNVISREKDDDVREAAEAAVRLIQQAPDAK
jgi:HEAT repeat protein/S1-C subfamily serine protease